MAGSWEMRQQQSILLGILHTENTTVAWALGLRNLLLPGEILPLAGMPFDMARNVAGHECLNRGFDYLGFLDSDVIPPRDAFLRLMRHGKPVISGLYTRRSPPAGVPVMMKPVGRWVTRFVPGSIVDVDVVGAGCLLPSTEVLTNFAPIRAEQIKRHRVLTGQGRYQRVVATRSKRYSGEVVGLSSYSFRDTTWITPEHPVFIIPREWMHWCKPDSPLAPSLIELFGKFVPAGQVRKGDCLATPIYKDVIDIEEIFLSDHLPDEEDVTVQGADVYYKSGRSPVTGDLVKYRNKVGITEDFLEFCGFYLAEGSAGKQLDIHLGAHEKDLVERVIELAAKCFGVKASTRTREGSTSIRIGGRVLAQFFRHNFGHSSDTKRIPQWIMSLPFVKQQGLLRGAVLGDGCCVPSRGKTGGVWVNYATVSRTLARQVQQLYLRGGYIAGLKSTPPQKGRSRLVTAKGRVRWIEARFAVWHVNLFSKMAWLFAKNVLGEDYPVVQGKWQKSFIVDGMLYSPTVVSRKDYSGPVFDFQVAEDQTYVAGNYLVHNCLLIHRSVLERLPPLDANRNKRWFDWRVDMNGMVRDPLSEDFAFCIAVKKALGIPILVDTSIVCRHVGYAESKPGGLSPCETLTNT